MSKLFKKTLISMFLLFGVIATSSTILTVWILYQHMTEEYVSKGRAIARSIANSNVEVLLNRDVSTIQSMIDQYLEIKGAIYVFVVDGAGEVISHTFVPSIPEEVLKIPTDKVKMTVTNLEAPGVGEVIDISKPILAGVAGFVHVGMDMNLIKSYILSVVLKMQALMFFIFWGSVLLLYIVVNRISQPLNKLTAYAGKLQQHDFNATMDIYSKDEIGLLADTMQSMAREISRLIAGLEREVSDATAELQETLTYLRAIIDNMADGLLVVDLEGKIALSNPAFSHLFDTGIHKLTGGNVSALLAPEIVSLVDLAVHQETEVVSMEVSLPNGRIGKAAATSVIHRLPGGREDGMACLGAVIIFRDITSEKEVDMMKTDFITTVSHELRTPLTSVLGFAKMIKKKLDDVIFPNIGKRDLRMTRTIEQVGDNIAIIVSEGERLTELINDVLDIAKMESGKIEWRDKAVSITEVIKRSVISTKSLYEKKGLDMAIEIEGDIPRITADRDRLIQVLVNLISNAVKFTEKGVIICKAWSDDKQITVSVADSGIGVTEKDKAIIFDRFQQVGETITNKPKGTGLGLPICKEILDHYGGRIWVESEVGQGSTFYFTLPLFRKEEASTSESRAQAQESEVDFHVHDFGQDSPLVLVVDDDPGVRSYLLQLLKSEGYRVLTAGDGESALDIARSRMPDIVTMDLIMPGMDGRSVIKRLRDDESTSDIPIIVISGAPERDKADGDATLVKPIDEERLIKTLNSLVGGQGVEPKECLILNNFPGDPKEEYLRLCNGKVEYCTPEDIWSRVDQGFTGIVFVPSGLVSDFDVVRLSGLNEIFVIVIP